MSIKSTVQRDPVSSILLKTVFILILVLISACITLSATNSIKSQLADKIQDIRNLESQECERKMTENVNKYQEELRDKLEKEYKDKYQVQQQKQEQNGGPQDGANNDQLQRSKEIDNIFSRGNAHQESQQEIILLKGKLEKLERQYGFMVSKFNNANIKIEEYKKKMGEPLEEVEMANIG